MSDCPCGSSRDFESCCGPYLAGVPAPTAEALMRARYTAYTRKEMAYLHDTLAGEARADYNESEAVAWAQQAEWRGLEIVATEAGGPDDSQGMVEFTARYRIKGKDVSHHERSLFRREDGRWYYVDGETPKPETRRVEKVGRNDPCPCGSGKKYKKCCAAA